MHKWIKALNFPIRRPIELGGRESDLPDVDDDERITVVLTKVDTDPANVMRVLPHNRLTSGRGVLSVDLTGVAATQLWSLKLDGKLVAQRRGPVGIHLHASQQQANACLCVELLSTAEARPHHWHAIAMLGPRLLLTFSVGNGRCKEVHAAARALQLFRCRRSIPTEPRPHGRGPDVRRGPKSDPAAGLAAAKRFAGRSLHRRPVCLDYPSGCGPRSA